MTLRSGDWPTRKTRPVVLREVAENLNVILALWASDIVVYTMIECGGRVGRLDNPAPRRARTSFLSSALPVWPLQFVIAIKIHDSSEQLGHWTNTVERLGNRRLRHTQSVSGFTLRCAGGVQGVGCSPSESVQIQVSRKAHG